MKTRFFSIICLTIFLAGCTKNSNESVLYSESVSAAQTTEATGDNITKEGTEASLDSVFPPEGIIAPVTAFTTPDKKIPVGRYVEGFELDGVEYFESEWGFWGFVIEDDGNIVVDSEPEFEDNEVVKALRELYSLEYVGLSHLNEHLFRYGDDLLAIANNPEGMQNNVFFKDSGYDESQYYYAYIFEAYKPNDVFPPEGMIAPITTTSLPVNDEPDEGVPGRLVERFYLEDVEYIESTWGTFGFVIEDDGDVVIDENWVADITDPDYENKVIEALHELYSLEYVGLSYLNEHLFRYGDDLLAIANNPEGMQNNVFFKDSGYDESQYYYAYIFEAYKPNDVFPPEGITAPTVAIPSEHQYETGEEIPAGNHVTRFELDGVKYTEALQHSYWGFVIEDDGNIIVEGEPEYEDNKVVKALREIYSLEYVGLSHMEEHLFRYGDDLLAIAKSPAEKNHSVYFKDYDYDESQFYYALIYEPYDN